MSTAFLYDDRFLAHDTGAGHPERADRLVASIERVRREPWQDGLIEVPARLCDDDEIRSIHSPEYLSRAQQACRQGAPFLDTPDVAINAVSYDTARLAAGGVLALCDSVMEGDADNAFALIRPPGHHAEQGVALGFCLLNNVAIAARYLQHRYSVEKVAIVDWDVHHGNGTQHLFEADPTVLYASLHQYPYYPGTGAQSEDGIGKGKGATVNCPMSAGCGDDDYETAFVERVLPAIENFGPDMVLISAGFDAHSADPLAQMQLSTGMFGWMTDRLLETADKHCQGRIVSMLEGGYDLRALSECVAVHLGRLAGERND